MTWRDALGRWARGTSDADRIARLPPAVTERVGFALQKTASSSPAPPAPPQDPAETWHELLTTARSITERVEKIEGAKRHSDAEVERLRKAGWTEEGIAALLQFKAEAGIVDMKRAIAAFERERHAEPVVSTGRRLMPHDRAAEAANAAAMKALMEGDDDRFLASAIPAALAEIRGG